jgi:glycerophosphoryl diester phosphodiesterase
VSAPNTLPAFAAALEDGADGLEFDLHQTGDGVLVCAHDGVLEGPSGSPVVLARTEFASLGHTDVGDASTGFARIPRLEEVFELFAPTDKQVNIEVKNLPHPYPGIARNLVRHVADSGMADRVVVSSFDHRVLRELQQEAPSLRVAALYPDGMLDPWVYLQAVVIPEAHPFYGQLLEEGQLAHYREASIPVRAWTVDDPEHWKFFLDAGIEGIITDRPASLRRLRDQE